MTGRITSWIAVALWLGTILALSSVSMLGANSQDYEVVLGALAHLAEYAILGVLLARVVGRNGAILLACCFAATDEIYQTFVPGRFGSPVDWLIDVGAAVIGVLAYTRFVHSIQAARGAVTLRSELEREI